MGLFGGNDKKCVFCGKEQGFLAGVFGINLAGGEYMCGDCREKCAPGDIDFSKLTVNNVRGMMEAMNDNRRKGQDFQATRKLNTGRNRNVDFLEVDEKHGWFRKASEKDAIIFDLNDVFHFTVNVEMAVLEEGESFDFYTYEYPELPRCPEGCRVTSAKLVIWFVKNRLGLEKLELDLIPTFSPEEGDARGGYACAHEFFELMRDYRNAQREY